MFTWAWHSSASNRRQRLASLMNALWVHWSIGMVSVKGTPHRNRGCVTAKPDTATFCLVVCNVLSWISKVQSSFENASR